MGQAEAPLGSAWLAQDFTAIDPSLVWDLVIVGSGYGAAMAASTLAGCSDDSGKPLRVALLERGREYLPGAFPSTLDELPGHVRIAHSRTTTMGRPDGLFDLRLAGDANALVANGLGGGSLINAGVLMEPRLGEFDSRLPAAVEKELCEHWLGRAKRLLGGEIVDRASREGSWRNNTIASHPGVQAHGPLTKTRALSELACSAVAVHPPAITVRLNTQDNAPDAVPLAACSLCGDCLTGCNVGAKASLDNQVLARAQQRGLAIYTSCSVLSLSRHHGLWQLQAAHTNPQVQGRRSTPVALLAHKVVLAAGSLGSSEILLRSRRSPHHPSGLALSPRLGEQFSLNGDNVASVRFSTPVRATADENLPLTGGSDGAGGVSPRRVGPEITASLEWRADRSGPGFLVQEFAVPAPLRHLFHETMGTRAWLEGLAAADKQDHGPVQAGERDPLAMDSAAMERELLVGLIGHDSASGRLVLPREDDPIHPAEGRVRVVWPGVAQDPAMADAYAKLQAQVHQQLGATARVTPNPLWRKLPEQLGAVAGGASNSVMTVHPLGGCPMGTSPQTGVVDTRGAVFQLDEKSDDHWHTSLLVLDGAIVPASLGANPALTIAALSLRAAEHWCLAWGWHQAGPHPKPMPPRPILRKPEDCLPPAPNPATQFQLAERLWGRVPALLGPRGREEHVVELSFAFEPATLAELTQPLKKRLRLTPTPPRDLPGANRLRIFRAADLQGRSLADLSETQRQDLAVVSAELSGHLDLLVRAPSLAWVRALRAFVAYGRNRGMRDLVLAWRQPTRITAGDVTDAIGRLWRLASQAGEVRRLEYVAKVDHKVQARHVDDQAFWERALQGTQIQGFKRFTYAWGENPWNQLLYLRLQRLGSGLLPRARWPWAPPVMLKLDARFLAGQGLPLLRITGQANQVHALRDLARLGLYGLRLLAKLQLWHMRAPDPPPPSPPQRLPGAVKGLPVPEITEIALETASHGFMANTGAACATCVRLTRYRGDAMRAQKHAPPPLVFIHGYSASGTTFAHDAIADHAAGHFWRAGRDIWILDLRTSAGLPSALLPWALEDVAWADIPMAIDHIATQVGRERGGPAVPVDVFAHCIGAVMLSMALLADPEEVRVPPRSPHAKQPPRRYPEQLARLNQHIHKVVLSQKGFYVDYSDANILRSFLINQFKSALMGTYHFRPPAQPSPGERLFDAFLHSLPYPPHEWPLDNPWLAQVPWGATRRRMDALYERTFNLEHMPRAVLDHIDDFFGPINLETISQVIHLARKRQITRNNGELIPLTRLPRWPSAGTLLLSAEDNGMVHPHSSRLMAEALEAHGIKHQRTTLPGGHQDMLMGQQSARTWRVVEGFLDA